MREDKRVKVRAFQFRCVLSKLSPFVSNFKLSTNCQCNICISESTIIKKYPGGNRIREEEEEINSKISKSQQITVS